MSVPAGYTRVFGEWITGGPFAITVRSIVDYRIEPLVVGSSVAQVSVIYSMEMQPNLRVGASWGQPVFGWRTSTASGGQGGSKTGRLTFDWAVGAPAGGIRTAANYNPYTFTVPLTTEPQALLLYFWTKLYTGNAFSFRFPFDGKFDSFDRGPKNGPMHEIPIPAILYDAPVAPTSASRARVNDQAHDVTWVWNGNPNSPTTPLERFEIRRTTTRISNVTVDSPARTLRGWRDASTYPDERFAWEVRAVGPTGKTSGWATTLPAHTTPAAATNATATRAGSAIQLSWDVKAAAGQSQTIVTQSSQDEGASWSGWSTLSDHDGLGPSVDTRVITGLSEAFWWRFAVVTKVTTPATLTTQSAASNHVRPPAPPARPQIVAPTGTESAPDGARLVWSHQPTDGSEQTAYEAQFGPVGGTVSTFTGTTPEFHHTDPLDRGSYRWRVRTKGVHPDWSPWSAYSTFVADAPPSASIVAPVEGEVLPSARVTVEAGFYDPQGRDWVSWTAEIRKAGATIYEGTFPATAPVVRLPVALEDEETYTLRVTTAATNGLQSSTVNVTFTTQFAPPPTPMVELEWAEMAGQVLVTITNPDPSGIVPPAVAVDLERSYNAGRTWEMLAEGLPPNTAWHDTEVLLNKTPVYRATAYSDDGADAASELAEVETGSWRVWFVAADGASADLSTNVAISVREGADTATEQYMGHRSPTAYFGVARPRTASITAKVPHYMGWPQLAALLGKHVVYRDPESRHIYGIVDGEIDTGQSGYYARNVSLTVREVERG